jgi:hypothetical protein
MADENPQERIRRRTFELEAVGLFVLVLYTVFTGFMSCSNKKAADAAASGARTADRTMRLDQRAWIAVTAVNGTKPELNKKFTYSVHFVDTGKTPASNVVIHPGDEMLPQGKLPNFSAGTEPAVRLGVLSPGSERTYDNGPVPPTRKIQTMTKEDLAALKAVTLSVHGKITYDDIFGRHHWITYCVYLRDDWSGYSFCSENNDTDADEEAR